MPLQTVRSALYAPCGQPLEKRIFDSSELAAFGEENCEGALVYFDFIEELD